MALYVRKCMDSITKEQAKMGDFDDTYHLWGDVEADQVFSDADYEPDMCGWCGKTPPCKPETHKDWSFKYD